MIDTRERPVARGASEPPRGSESSVLTDPEASAETPAALDRAGAVPVVAATPRLEDAAIARRLGTRASPLERAAHHPLPAATLHAGRIDRHAGDGAIGLRR